MRKVIKKGTHMTEIIYAESLNSYYEKISSQIREVPAVFFVTTQPFYEKYYERLTNLLKKKQAFEWYICPNNETISYVNTLNEILNFLEKTELPTGTLIVGAGNHHIYHLGAFLKDMSLYLNSYIYFSTTLTGVSESLNGQAYLMCNRPFCLGANAKVLPNLVVFNQALRDLEGTNAQSQDIKSLIQLGVTTNRELFDFLIQIRPSKPNSNLLPYLENVIECQQYNYLDAHIYIMAFAKSFYQLNESHYLSLNQKEHIAFLLYFLLGIEKNEIYIDFKSFLLWYERMICSQLDIPIQMNTYDLAQSVLNELNRFTKFIGIQSIGKLAQIDVPSLEELYQVIERYRKIKEE